MEPLEITIADLKKLVEKQDSIVRKIYLEEAIEKLEKFHQSSPVK